MKKIITTSLFALGLFTTQAQDLSIGNISAGYEYNQTTGIIKDIYFTILSNENTGASNFKVGIYFVPPGVTSLDQSYLLESSDVPSISGNSSRDVTNWTIDVNKVATVPPNGTYRLLVYVDNEKVITETNESNNGLFISTQGNDLKFTASTSSGINDVKNNSLSFSSFPNPVISNTEISFSLKQNNTGSIHIYDITGKEMMNVITENTTFLAGKNTIPLNTQYLPAGIYQCVLQTNEGIATQKIVKQ